MIKYFWRHGEINKRSIIKRVSNGMKNLSNKNILRSRPPFGYKFIGKQSPFEKDEEQQKVIEIIKDLYLNNKMKINKIATYLNEMVIINV